MPETKTPTIGERIVVHLSQYVRHEGGYVVPAEMTQGGIAHSLGISRAHASIELRRQIDAGRIVVRMAHVAGAPTRRKVYHLTPRGESVARNVRDRALARRVELVLPDGRAETLRGPRALDALRRFGIAEGRAVFLLLTRTRIDVRNPALRRPPEGPRPVVLAEAAAYAAFERMFVRPIAWQFEVILGPPHMGPVAAAA